MPNYGLHRYGEIQYGKYKMTIPDGGLILGPHTRYKIRTIDSNRNKSSFLVINKDRLSLPGNRKVRIRSGNGSWVYTQSESLPKETNKVRVRSISRTGEKSDWVINERGELGYQK